MENQSPRLGYRGRSSDEFEDSPQSEQKMTRSLIFMVSFLLPSTLICPVTQADDIEIVLDNAKADFDKTLSEIQDTVLRSIKSKLERAQAVGDLKEVESLSKEIDRIENASDIASAVETKQTSSRIQRARAKLTSAYETAIRDFTRDGQLALAKAVQAELEGFRAGRSTAQPDIFTLGSKWSGIGDVRKETALYQPGITGEITVREKDAFQLKVKVSSGPQWLLDCVRDKSVYRVNNLRQIRNSTVFSVPESEVRWTTEYGRKMLRLGFVRISANEKVNTLYLLVLTE